MGAGILAPALGISCNFMKIFKTLFLFIIIFVATLFLWKGFFAVSSVASPLASPIASVSIDPIVLPSSQTVFDEPASLIIPKLKVDAVSESVGMDSEGRMDVPKNVVNVAWYNLGVKPGERGNAVFAGHFDKPDGSPAVFNKLGTLKAGDILTVVDVNGKELQFEVTEKRVVQLSEFPLQEVFGETDKTRVNLITCGGKWDKEKKEYSERTIIFSELKTT